MTKTSILKITVALWVGLILAFAQGPAFAQEGDGTDAEEPEETPAGQLLIRVEDDPSQLYTGDAQLIGYNSGINFQFSFVLLSNIGKGTPIYLTDNGWSTIANLNNTEGTYVWTAPRDMCAGTVIQVSDSGLNVPFMADQFFLYHPSPDVEGQFSFLHGISLNQTDGGWQTDSINEERSQLPYGLVAGQTALTFPSRYAVYDGPVIGTRDDIRAAINNPENWFLTDDDPQIMPSEPFAIVDSTACEVCNLTFGQEYVFGGGLKIEMDALGKFVPLECVSVEYFPEVHPAIPAEDQFLTLTEGVWKIDKIPAEAEGFQASITAILPEDATEETRLCRLVSHNAAEWDCNATEFVSNRIRVDGMSEFSELVIGNSTLDIYSRPGEELTVIEEIFELLQGYPGIISFIAAFGAGISLLIVLLVRLYLFTSDD